ncbi:MAG: hypothetical protein CVU43_17590 [Chloroflexi bacterium HGW-Chloroflexi-5]|jgi:hypothetical protein|nr:MAG: hypothetical protein CVU43_17590 [Chloroflexi bacterium HGW-Chloroflexi-5]
MYRITPDAVEAIQLHGPNFWASVSCPAVDKVWFVGGNKILFYDGNTLEYSSGIIGGYFNSILFANASLGWTANDISVGGYYEPKDSWVHLVDYKGCGWDMCNIGEDHLWVVGSQGLLMNTHNAKDFKRLDDGHAEVNVVWETPEHPLGDVFFSAVHATSVHNVFAVGVDKCIMKYTAVSGIGDEEKNTGGIEVWPNPTTGQFKVQSSKFKVSVKVDKVEIVDLFGKSLDFSPLHRMGEGPGAVSMELDISHLPPGLYFIKIKIEDQIIVKKIIKL